jgi:hypothetical protein
VLTVTEEAARAFSRKFYGRDDHEPTTKAIMDAMTAALSLMGRKPATTESEAE